MYHHCSGRKDSLSLEKSRETKYVQLCTAFGCVECYYYLVAAEKLKAIMESSSAWELARTSLVGEHDGIKIPECGERFMLLLSSISGMI